MTQFQCIPHCTSAPCSYNGAKFTEVAEAVMWRGESTVIPPGFPPLLCGRGNRGDETMRTKKNGSVNVRALRCAIMLMFYDAFRCGRSVHLSSESTQRCGCRPLRIRRLRLFTGVIFSVTSGLYNRLNATSLRALCFMNSDGGSAPCGDTTWLVGITSTELGKATAWSQRCDKKRCIRQDYPALCRNLGSRLRLPLLIISILHVTVAPSPRLNCSVGWLTLTW